MAAYTVTFWVEGLYKIVHDQCHIVISIVQYGTSWN